MERRYIFTMLISELSSQGVITNVQGSALLARFTGGDKSIDTCLDEYEEGRNMQILVEDLKTMAAAC